MGNMAYTARKECGCMVAAAVDDNRDQVKTIANEVAGWIKEGYTVERVTCDYVRENWRTCTCFPVSTTRKMFVSDNAQEE